MRIEVKYIDSSQNTFMEAYEMGREAAKKAWGTKDD